jgi:hypothetical protein
LIFALGISICSGDEVDAHLKRLNKPPVKSIQIPDGDIIDCVHISQQIAFDHPSLKNHIIQMEPSSIPKGLSNEEELEQLWHMNVTCPKETIPVMRTKREDVLRAKSIESYGTKHHKSIGLHETEPPATVKHEYAIARTGAGKYYGAKAIINIWKPAVMLRKEFSLSQLWLVAGSGSNLNSIEAGWQEYPQWYGDSRPRFFIYWTRDGYGNTGCYNLKCSGFVQTNRRVVIGGPVPVSKYNGVQREMTILVWKDRRTGHWWLKMGSNVVGYWPARIFTGVMKKYATRVDWGGEIINYKSGGKHTTTDMGSGQFPDKGYRKASYFRNVATLDASNILRTPRLTTLASPSAKCYNIKIGTRPISGWGKYFYYGGSGRNSACH